MLDHGDGTGQPDLVQQVLEGRLQKPSDLTRDDILDNITLFWLTNTGVSSARLYSEFKGGFFTAEGVTIPVGVSLEGAVVDWALRAPLLVQSAGAPDGDADCWSCLCRARRKSAAGSSSRPTATPRSSNQRDSAGVSGGHTCVGASRSHPVTASARSARRPAARRPQRRRHARRTPRRAPTTLERRPD